MIAFLRGQVLAKNNNYIILLVDNIGYQVFVSESLSADLKSGQPAELYTHQYVREDALDLYGFKSLNDLSLFEMLLSVSGIGPKSALGVLSMASSEEVIQSIARGDSQLLTKVSGIGQKTAERIVLELKNKVVRLGGDSDSAFGASGSDEIDALMALGYSLSEAREALRAISPSIIDSGERLKEALKNMRK